jgi:hypothetical protein
MGEGPGGCDFDALEQDIVLLPGVTHARLVVDKGRIIECHVVSDGLKDPRQLKRDIETLAVAKHNCEIDHKVISITELPGVIVRAEDDRIVVVSVSVKTAGGSATCDVVVKRGDSMGEGSAAGVPTSIPKLVARATLDACSKVLGEALPAEVLNAFIVQIDAYNTATVVLKFADAEGNETQSSGTASVRGDQNLGVAQAAVDAVRRHLGM